MNRLTFLSAKSVWKLLSGVVVALSVVFFVLTAFHNFQDVPNINWEYATIIVCLISVLMVVAGVSVVAYIWQLLVSDHGVSHSTRQAQAVVGLSQLGKYLPGNVGQHIGRISLAKSYGVDIPVALTAMGIEMLLGVAVAMLLGAASAYSMLSGSINAIDYSSAEIFVVAIFVLSLPWVGILALNYMCPSIVERVTGQRKIKIPSIKIAFFVVVLFVLCFLFFGVILKLHAQFLFGVPNVDLVQMTCLFALAWVAGYLVPGAPAGLGVRETIMVILLSPVLGEGVAVALSVSLRLTTTFGDALAFLCGLIWQKYC